MTLRESAGQTWQGFAASCHFVERPINNLKRLFDYTPAAESPQALSDVLN
jgi:hypothetical protein